MPDGFGVRDAVAMSFIGLMVLVVWLAFRHLFRLSQRKADDEQQNKP